MKVTELMAVKLLPSIVTVVPGPPKFGVKEAIVGTRVTTKSVDDVPVPFPVVTVIRPVVTPEGTLVVICELEVTVNGALTPLNLTVIVPENPDPVRTTVVPTGPLAGVNDEMTGGPGNTVKFVVLVAEPFGVKTEILPVVAFVGTVAVIRVDELTVKDAPTPLN